MAYSFTKSFQHSVYAAISPCANPHHDRKFLVTGAAAQSGIGFTVLIAASASHVIITGRHEQRSAEAVNALLATRLTGAARTEVSGFICDTSSEEDMEALWTKLALNGIEVYGLILCARWVEHVLASEIELSVLEEAFETMLFVP